MAGKTTYKAYPCEFEWARVYEHNRDMGGDDNDTARKIASHEGQYCVDLIVDEETKQKMIADGIPEASLGWQQFKPVEGREGYWRYKAKRPHINLKLTDRDTGEPVVYGPPNVVDWEATQKAGEPVPITDLIGNGSTGYVKLSIYKNGSKRIITLESIAVENLVEYSSEGGSGGVKW